MQAEGPCPAGENYADLARCLRPVTASTPEELFALIVQALYHAVERNGQS